MIVEAQNDLSLFNIQLAPYTDDITQSDSRHCYIEYDDPSQYVYAVALGKNPSTFSFFFVGEMTGLEEDDELANRTFVGFLNYTGSPLTIDCEFNLIIKYVEIRFVHQEHLVMTTDALGLVAYGFSDRFTFSYAASNNNLSIHLNNSLSPSTAFLPYAVDYDGSHGIIAGFLSNGLSSRIKYRAAAILFSIDALTTIATNISIWKYPTNDTTWQAGQTNAGADQHDPKFDMSVSINPTATQVLIGIQSMNTVFLLSYATLTLTLVTSIDNGRGLGFGKGVAWLNDTLNSVVILANVYSTNYVWSSSKIYVYDSPLANTSRPVSIFPNSQQPLYSYMSSVFLNIITNSLDLVLLDDQGGLFVILSAPIGHYSSTVGPTVEIMPAFSSQVSCMPGTYKNVTGIRRCFLCPAGTKNDGINSTITTCVDCAINTFCPLGSASDSISNDQLNNVTQTVAYPKSPDITGLDDILFFTLFSIGSSARCVALSPIFWTIIVAAIVIVIVSVMLVIKYCIKNPRAINSYKLFEKVFKQTDIIREGNMWAGGLATFCVIVLCVSCCVFSAKYYSSYPIETSGPSTYTCDTSIRNAQFSSSLRSLSVPVEENIQGMIDLLNDQAVNLDVSFLNTVYNCTSDEVTLTYLLGATWLPVSPNRSCKLSSYIVSYSALLPFRSITVQFTLPNIYTIGGLRVGLSAPGKKETSTITLQDLGFSQTFNQSGHMLGQDARIALQLTKVINSTSPLVKGEDDILSGIWIGSFTVNYYESFMTDTDYLNAPPKTSTNLILVISETPYYIQNEQSPIARLPEMIYHDFLFITMIIGMFVLIFVIVEVMILPCVASLIRKCTRNADDKYRTDSSRQSVSAHDNAANSIYHSNRQESRELKHNSAIVDNVALFQRQKYTLNQYANRSEDDTQQLPPMWNRQAYL
ncbi:unnamed protein product [Rotaria sp. Silwood2]|nr:unnamed protein product [Rotaria sp. Silwood2]CAF3885940.1 unnamed protein product [Rotaria sp. Silwood2]